MTRNLCRNPCTWAIRTCLSLIFWQTVALADVEITSLMNIQNQFVGESIQYPLESCQFFYTPMLLEERWILIMWDMLWMLIHVVTSDLNKEHYDLIALWLHDALFASLTRYFAGWSVPKNEWAGNYRKVVDSKFPGKTLGYAFCTSWGTTSAIDLNSLSRSNFRKQSIHDLMKLSGQHMPSCCRGVVGRPISMWRPWCFQINYLCTDAGLKQCQFALISNISFTDHYFITVLDMSN